jgi:Uma2 family endonuclease
MTVDEYWEFVNRPENADRLFELRRGEVIELPRPTRLHGIVANRIGGLLMIYADRVGKGYATSNDAGVVLDEEVGTVVGPDVAYFTDVNKYREVHPKWGEGVPVLAVEVLSPNDKLKKVLQKIEDYLKSGVAVVWLVNYEECFVTVFRNDQPPRVVDEVGELTVDEMPGFTCRVADLFRLPGDRPEPTSPANPGP